MSEPLDKQCAERSEIIKRNQSGVDTGKKYLGFAAFVLFLLY